MRRRPLGASVEYYKNYSVVTALPRVGVERPNGSYVARTFNRVGRVISSRSETNVAGVVTRLPNNYSIRYEWRKETCFLFPLHLYTVAKCVACLDARRISFLDVSASQSRSSVRAMRPKGFAFINRENENMILQLTKFLSVYINIYYIASRIERWMMECRRPDHTGGNKDTRDDYVAARNTTSSDARDSLSARTAELTEH